MSTLPRPREVTVAGWLVMGGGIAVVVTAWDQVARLHSLDSQTTWQKVLTEPPVDDFGLTLDGLLDIVHVLAMVAGGCATAAVILGWHALQRSRSSRVALSVVAVPLFLAGSMVGSVFPTVVAVAIVMLWLQPARDWYAGRPQAAPPPRTSTQPRPQQRPSTSTPSSGWPAPTPTRGVPVARAAPATPASDGDRRPSPLVAAGILTWVASLLGILLLIGVGVYVAGHPDKIWQQAVQRSPDLVKEGYTRDAFLALLSVGIVVGVGWFVVAGVMALLAWLRIDWARIVLIAMAGVSAVGLLVGSLFSPALAVPMIGAVLVLALLVRPDVVAWFRRPRDPRGPGGPAPR